jgi:hypothetical protein
MKVCNKCKIEKEFNEFHFRKDNNKYRNDCKICINTNSLKNYFKNIDARKQKSKEYYLINSEKIKNKVKQYSLNNKEKIKEYCKEHRLKNLEKIKEVKKINYLNNKDIILKKQKNYRKINNEKVITKRKIHYLKNKEIILKKQKQYYNQNKDVIKKRNKEYYLNNTEIFYKNGKQYRLNNKEKIKKYSRLYIKNRCNNDKFFKLIQTIRRSISDSLRKKGYTKKSRTYQILGCTYEEFKIYIENKFIDGMNWENHGKWHFDHIYPVSKAKDEEHLIKLNHYTNFQPLWAEDNLKKGNKILC